MRCALLVAAFLSFQDDAVRQEYEEKRAAAPQTAKGQYDLGRWCDARKLRDEAIKAYERSVEIDPDYAPAQHALGRKKVLGRWASDRDYANPAWWAHPKVDQKKVDDAILKGCGYLLSQIDKLPEGSHVFKPAGPMKIRMEGLVLLALLESGWDRNDAKIKALVQRVLGMPLDLTYHVSIRAMCLAELDASKYQQPLAQCAQYLVDNQHSGGGWGYGKPAQIPPSFSAKESGPIEIETGSTDKPAKRPKQIEIKKGRSVAADDYDASNSQYAALGIRACLSGLVVVPKETLQAAEEYWEKSQDSTGGWGYVATHNRDSGAPYGSMTAGSVGALAIYKYMRNRVWGEKIDIKNAPSVSKGVGFMGQFFDAKKNPNLQYGAWAYYWFYAVERAGRLLETEQFGTHEWYPEIAIDLLTRQTADGSWEKETWDRSLKDKACPGPVLETCFAILFLRRATPKLADTIPTGDSRK